jgi:hypothetical protein
MSKPRSSSQGNQNIKSQTCALNGSDKNKLFDVYNLKKILLEDIKLPNNTKFSSNLSSPINKILCIIPKEFITNSLDKLENLSKSNSKIIQDLNELKVLTKKLSKPGLVDLLLFFLFSLRNSNLNNQKLSNVENFSVNKVSDFKIIKHFRNPITHYAVWKNSSFSIKGKENLPKLNEKNQQSDNNFKIPDNKINKNIIKYEDETPINSSLFIKIEEETKPIKLIQENSFLNHKTQRSPLEESFLCNKTLLYHAKDVSIMAEKSFQEKEKENPSQVLKEIIKLFSTKIDNETLFALRLLINPPAETMSILREVLIFKKYSKIQKQYVLIYEITSETEKLGLFLKIDPFKKKYSLVKKSF